MRCNIGKNGFCPDDGFDFDKAAQEADQGNVFRPIAVVPRLNEMNRRQARPVPRPDSEDTIDYNVVNTPTPPTHGPEKPEHGPEKPDHGPEKPEYLYSQTYEEGIY